MQELLMQFLGEVHSALRFRWYGLALAWGFCLLGWLYVASKPDIYEGSARFYVDTSSILKPVLGKQIADSDVNSQMVYVRQALLGRSELEDVAHQVGLDSNVKTLEQREALLQALRDKIDVEVDSSDPDPRARSRSASANSVYSITYRDKNRRKAVGVVNVLLNSFIENALGENRRDESTAGQFLNQQVKDYAQRLQEAEQALANFKKKNSDILPGAQGDYFKELQSERDALSDAKRQLQILEAKRAQQVKQLKQEAQVIPGVRSPGTEPAPGSLDARIQSAQQKLDTMLLQYTDEYPDVIELRKTLKALKAERQKQLAALGLKDSDVELRQLEANPVYQQLQIALNQTDLDIAGRKTEIKERQAKVANLQGLINEVPEVEAQLQQLTRNYDVIHQRYLDLVGSRETQDLTSKAAATDNVDFKIIDPPLASMTPVAPRRLVLLALVFVGSLGAGGALCYALSQLRPVFSNVRALRAIVELPVLGIVPHAWPAVERREQRRATSRYAVALTGLVLLFGALVGIQLFGPGVRLPLG